MKFSLALGLSHYFSNGLGVFVRLDMDMMIK